MHDILRMPFRVFNDTRCARLATHFLDRNLHLQY